ncbi:MAG: hypothetical protein JOZ58_15615 [Acetobacteraceae bacterium]|nr:hypothetical protein [Acetobacteraceae bacterium]
MRSVPIWLTTVLALVAAPAVGQPTYPPPGTYPPGTYPPPSSYPPPPPASPPNTYLPSERVTGARPGNPIGTGSSLPMGNRSSNILPGGPEVAPNLPSPAVGQDASPRAFLLAARNALAAGRTGEAQQSLEMAQTRLLDRSVPLFQTNTPDQSPAVTQISQALQALGAHDRARAMQIIDATIPQVADTGPAQ